jgi:CAAX protease family protein
MADEETGPGEGKTRQEPPHCYAHDLRPAVALCVTCGRPVCGECDRRYGYQHHCPQCLPATYSPLPYAPVVYLMPPPPMQPPEPEGEREKRWWRADWGLGETFIALAIIFIPYNILGTILYFASRDLLYVSYLAYGLFFCPLTAFTVWFVVKRHHRGWKELGVQWADAGRTWAYGLLGALAALVVSYGVFFLILLLFYLIAGRMPGTAESEQLREVGGGTLAIVIFSTVVLAPIFEELFFRGLFYPALRRRLGWKMAIFLDALIFGALHFQPLFLISLVGVGAVLAYLYEKTDSLFAPMITHALYNLVVVIISLLVGW